MLNFYNKISRGIAFIVLLVYLTITTINAFHYHKIVHSNESSLKSTSEQNQNLHYYLGSEFFCVIQFAYSSISTSLVSFDNRIEKEIDKPSFVDLEVNSQNPLNITFYSSCLRAPPFSLC